MKRNLGGQSVTLLAVNVSTGLPQTGDSANQTWYQSIDDGPWTELTGTIVEDNATEAKGLYSCPLTAAQTNGTKILFSGTSETSNVIVIPKELYTTPGACAAPGGPAPCDLPIQNYSAGPDAVDQALVDPASFETDGLSAAAQPIPDVIKGANRQAGRQALSGTNRRGGARSAWGCLRPAKVIPPGTSYDVDHEGLDR